MKNLLKKFLALAFCLCMLTALVPSAAATSSKKILFIGSDLTNDTVFYLADLAHLAGESPEISVIGQENADLRVLAAASVMQTALPYYQANAATKYKLTPAADKISIQAALKAQNWDIIVLQNGLLQSAIRGMYSSDLKYLTDMVEDLQPSAKLYWNMPWAVDSDSKLAKFDTFFEKNQIALYNNLLACTEQFIASNASFDGILYTGTAIQNARATALGEKMLRNEKNLSYKQGRLLASMTALKTLYPSADLGKITASALQKILTDDDETQKDSYVNSDTNLSLIKSAVISACSGKPTALPDTYQLRSVSDDSLFTVVQNELPYQYEIPEVTVMDNGDIYVSAYENVLHTPVLYTPSYESKFPDASDVRLESGGIFVFFRSTDGGKTFEKIPFTVDDAQMEAWGLVSLSDRYQKLKADPNYNYTYYFDPRDPDIKSLHVDVNGDGEKENILFLTFWVRSFMKNGQTTNGNTYCTYSTDGGKTWATPVSSCVGVKCGDVTEFADGTILMPSYSSGCATCTYITVDQNGKLHSSHASTISDGKWDSESADGMETSFVAPNGGDTVYAFIRPSGIVMRSEDRGKTWTLIYNVTNGITQPGFKQIDENRVFVTWTTGSPREVFGKVFYLDGSWADSGEKLLYGIQHSTSSARDVGDPSCTLLPSGKVLVTCYDSYYHSVIGTVQDPDDPTYARTSVSAPYRAVPQTGTALASRQTVSLDGKATEFDMYKIVDEDGGETNFIKLRDIAYLLSGTKAQFGVKYNAKSNYIALMPGKVYASDGSELQTPFSGDRAFKTCQSVVKINGETQGIAGITLTDDAGGDYNYFKLRDLGTLLGFKVDWSAERGIFVDTTAK